jgi:c-di-GMP-binding flagellar brake protein YcgR
MKAQSVKRYKEIRVSTEGLRLRETISERRSKLRICVPFHVEVKGVDSMGDEFGTETVLDNLSANGLYVRIMPTVEAGAKLSIVIGLYTPSQVPNDAARVSIEGSVLRTEKKVGGVLGVAVGFDSVRFL